VSDSKPYVVGRVDGMGVTKRFATHDEAAMFISKNFDPQMVEAGTYYIDGPEEPSRAEFKVIITADSEEALLTLDMLAAMVNAATMRLCMEYGTVVAGHVEEL